MTGSTRSRRRIARRHKKRLFAAALCAASFFTGQLFGGDAPEPARAAAPSILGEYSQAKSKVAGAADAAARDLQSLESTKTPAQSLRPAAVQAASELPLVAAPTASQVAPADEAGEVGALPPIVPAWALPRPGKKAAAESVSKTPVASPAVATHKLVSATRNAGAATESAPASPQLRIELGQTETPAIAAAASAPKPTPTADNPRSQRRVTAERWASTPAAASKSAPADSPATAAAVTPVKQVTQDTKVTQSTEPANEPSEKPVSNVQRLLSASTGGNETLRKADYEIRTAALQPAAPQPLIVREDELGALPAGSPFEAIEQSGVVKLRVRRAVLLRTKVDIYRTAIVDESVCDIVQFTPREVSIIGRSVGQTHVTFWLDNAATAPLTYLVDVQPDPQQLKADESKYELLQNVINEMFPDSKIYLVLVADKLLVKGQAKDSEEAAQIMTIVRAQASGVAGGAGLGGVGLAQGAATPVLSNAATGSNNSPSYQIINMLRVPGVQQVALKVKIAELNRSAARGFGIDAKAAINFTDSAKSTQLFLASLLNTTSGAASGGAAANGGTSVVTSFGGREVNIGLRYLQERGVIRLLSEPTLVTLSGRPATFIAGGEFAVPTIVGSVGLNAVTTDFRAFGAIISFLPTIVDKDRIRLQVAPEFSAINSALTSNNTPGLNVRAATTTVEMREGQTLAIAGLLEDSYKATTVGDLPGLAKIFGRRDTTRNETELIILVTPELVQPMEPEEVPPLPGFDITEPTGSQFFLHGEIEGNPTQDYRSTVWPRLRRRYGTGGPAMTSGPFGHGQ